LEGLHLFNARFHCHGVYINLFGCEGFVEEALAEELPLEENEFAETA
jgi:hypothetical protein